MNADDISFSDLAKINDNRVSSSSISDVNTLINTQITPASKDIHLFDLYDLGIEIVGSFDQTGAPIGWSFHGNPIPYHYLTYNSVSPNILYCGPAPSYFVYIRGNFSKKLTNERRRCVGLAPL